MDELEHLVADQLKSHDWSLAGVRIDAAEARARVRRRRVTRWAVAGGVLAVVGSGIGFVVAAVPGGHTTSAAVLRASATPPQPSTGQNAAVPWRPLPGRTVSSAPVAVLCARHDLHVSTMPGVYHGRDLQDVLLVNAGSAACRLPGTVTVSGGRLADGRSFPLSLRADGKPVVLARGATAAVSLSKPDGCPGMRPRSQVLRGFRLAVGALTFAVDRARLDVTCGGVSVAAPVITATADAQPTYAAELQLPPTVAPGSTLSFSVVVTNVSSTDQSLTPCPSYTETIATVTTETYQLNCAAAPAMIPAGASVTFDMQLAVPADAPTGPAKVGWQLDTGDGGGGVITIG